MPRIAQRYLLLLISLWLLTGCAPSPTTWPNTLLATLGVVPPETGI